MSSYDDVYVLHNAYHIMCLTVQASEITDGVQQVLQSIAAGKAEVCQQSHINGS